MLNMTCLDGTLQGRTFSLFEGLKLSNSADDEIVLEDIKAGYYAIEVNSEGLLKLSAKDSAAPILVAGDKESEITLIPGVMFSIGSATFAIQEADDDQIDAPSTQIRKQASMAFKEFAESLIEASKTEPPINSVKLLKTPLKFEFIRGFWINQSWLLQHSPIDMGSFSPIYFFQDDSIKTKDTFLTLELKGDKNTPHLSTPFDGLIHVNGEAITSQEIFDGDFVEFGKTAFYISFHEDN
jgi:hypothetical protein